MPSRADGREAPTLQPFGQEAQPVTGGPQQFNLTAAAARKMKTWPDMGSSFSAVCTFAAAVEAISHIGDTGNQPNFGPGR
ncbi:hypothetical protein ECZU28_23710 [Escherichia coli]|nr:hypothetical protein ECZU28_23710 [Escherichia coli]